MNEEKYYYSASSNSFFALSLKQSYEDSGTWPEDGVPVSDDIFSEFTSEPPEGMIRSSKDGYPAWIAKPPPSKEEMQQFASSEKARLMDLAAKMIAPLQDAVDLDMATDKEKNSLAAWKKYRVLLNRIDTGSSPIEWPEQP